MKGTFQILAFCFFIILSSLSNSQEAGYAIQFDGIDDYIIIPNLVNNLPEGTVETWIKYNNPAPGPNGSYIFSATQNQPLTGNADGTNFGIHPYFGNDLLVGTFSQAWNWAASGVVPIAGTWYHVAGTWSSNGINIYINGELKGTNSYSGASYLTNYNIIGASSWPQTSIDGELDEFRIWNIERTQIQIQEAMYYHLSGNDSGLVGYWKFDEGSGVEAGDSSGNNNLGTLTNGPAWVTSSAPITTTIQCINEFIPNNFQLEQNYPNPFNPTTKITFIIPFYSFVTVKVYNSLGEDIATLFAEQLNAGKHETKFDAGSLSSGVYFYRIEANVITQSGFDSFTQTKKLILLR